MGLPGNAGPAGVDRSFLSRPATRRDSSALVSPASCSTCLRTHTNNSSENSRPHTLMPLILHQTDASVQPFTCET